MTNILQQGRKLDRSRYGVGAYFISVGAFGQAWDEFSNLSHASFIYLIGYLWDRMVLFYENKNQIIRYILIINGFLF